MGKQSGCEIYIYGNTTKDKFFHRFAIIIRVFSTESQLISNFHVSLLSRFGMEQQRNNQLTTPYNQLPKPQATFKF